MSVDIIEKPPSGSAGDFSVPDGFKLVIGYDKFETVAGIIPSFQILGTDIADTTQAIIKYSTDAAGPNFIGAKVEETTLIGGFTAINDNDELVNFRGYGADGIDLATEGARIRFRIDGSPANNRMPTEIAFAVAEGAGDNDIADAWIIRKTGVLEAQGAQSITTTSGNLTIAPVGDIIVSANVFLANGIGQIVGHTAQETISSIVPESQILGTIAADSSLALIRYSISQAGPNLIFGKSGATNGPIGTRNLITDNEVLGNIIAVGDDGVDLGAANQGAIISFRVDGTPAVNRIPTEMVFSTAAGVSDGDLAEKWRIKPDGTLESVGAHSITTTTGDLTLDPIASLNVTLTAGDADAFTANDGSTDYYNINTLITTDDVAVHVFSATTMTVTSNSTTSGHLVEIAARTYNFNGGVNITTPIDGMGVRILAPIVASDASVVITQLSTLYVAAPDVSDAEVTGTLVLAAEFDGNILVVGDVFTTAWTTFGGSSTIVGWVDPLATSTLINYKKIGNIVFIAFYLDGVSDTTTVTFTLPFTQISTNGVELKVAIQAGDNSAILTTSGLLTLSSNSNTVSCFLDMSGAAWTASNNKRVQGQFWYEAQ